MRISNVFRFRSYAGLVLAALAVAVGIARADGFIEVDGIHPEDWLIIWNYYDTSRSLAGQSPCLAATASDDYIPTRANSCNSPSRNQSFDEFSVTVIESLGSTEGCFVFPKFDDVFQSQFLIVSTATGNTCTAEIGTGDMDTVGDSCMRRSPTTVPAYTNWYVHISGVNCSVMTGIQMAWKGSYP